MPCTPESERALEQCKLSIANAARTGFLSPSAHLLLATDASDTAIGAALEQLIDDVWQPVGFFSRKLSPTEGRYSTDDRDLLTIFAAIKFFRHILEGRKFTIRTDRKPLVHAFSQKARPRQLNQLQFISEITIEIVFLKGKEKVVADAS